MATLADLVARAWDEAHPGNLNALLCERCRRRKDRKEFREEPWHGRAAMCLDCEIGQRSYTAIDYTARLRWELEQEREKVRALKRHRDRLVRQRASLARLVFSLRSEVRTANDVAVRAIALMRERGEST